MTINSTVEEIDFPTPSGTKLKLKKKNISRAADATSIDEKQPKFKKSRKSVSFTENKIEFGTTDSLPANGKTSVGQHISIMKKSVDKADHKGDSSEQKDNLKKKKNKNLVAFLKYRKKKVKKTLPKKERQKRKARKALVPREPSETEQLARAYLLQWHTDRENWKFQKLMQCWLIENALNKQSLPKSEFAVLLDYLAGCRGNAVSRLRDCCIQAIRTEGQSTVREARGAGGGGGGGKPTIDNEATTTKAHVVLKRARKLMRVIDPANAD